jgi:hypothetical protein
VLISSPSEMMFTFSTVHITVRFSRFKLRPTISVLFLTNFISSFKSSLLSPSTVLSSACVMVFIFHVTFPIPVTISATPPVFIMYSLYRLNRTGEKIEPCVTPFVLEPFCCALLNLHFGFLLWCRSCTNTVKCLVITKFLLLFLF